MLSSYILHNAFRRNQSIQSYINKMFANKYFINNGIHRKSFRRLALNEFLHRYYSKGFPESRLKTFATGPKFSKNEIKRLITQAKPEKWKLAGAVCLLFVSSGVTMAVPFCIGKVIDVINTAEGDQKKEHLRAICKFFIVIFIIGALANFGRVYLIQTSGQRIVRNVRHQVFSSIMKQEITFFDRNKTGELINRLSSDAALIGQCITQNISDGLRSFTSAIACTSMMVYMSPQLAMIGLGIVPPVAAIGIIYGRIVRNVTRSVQEKLAETTQVADERIGNIRTVKAFVQEEKEKKQYAVKLNEVLDLQYVEAFARAAFYGMAGLSGNLIVLSILYYGGTLMADAEITVGNLSAFLMYAAYMGISLAGLSSFYAELMRGIGASVKLWSIIDRDPAIPSTGLTPLTPPQGNIQFNNVHFTYPTRSKTSIFEDLNLNIEAGSVTAIVGESGVGKSTLIALLLRHYDPDKGDMFLDGKNFKVFNPNWLRSNIGIVTQEPVLFSCSIRENILYGIAENKPVSEEEVIDAAKDANALNFINSFPDAFDTIVGERGTLLSGGQKQRIAIARAILKNSSILVLDEATSALDAESEHLVQEALDRLMTGRTVIIIAHRLSTIKKANQIAVISNKCIVEKGTYKQLMQMENGKFRKLVERQTIPHKSNT